MSAPISASDPASPDFPRYSEERRIALKRDNYTCQYCDDRPAQPTADHVEPRSRGGSDSRHNLVCACSDCNGRKGRRTPAEWYTILKAHPLQERRPAERLYFQKLLENLEARFLSGEQETVSSLLPRPPYRGASLQLRR